MHFSIFTYKKSHFTRVEEIIIYNFLSTIIDVVYFWKKKTNKQNTFYFDFALYFTPTQEKKFSTFKYYIQLEKNFYEKLWTITLIE